MLLAQISLWLFLSSFVSAAAIPSSTLSDTDILPEWSSPESVSSLSSPPSDGPSPKHLAKRRPYYFPETVPDEEEIAARLAALREAGYLPQEEVTQQAHDQKSIGTPDAAIDMVPSSARPSPIQEPPSALSGRDVPRFIWEDSIPGLLPAAWFFVFASVVVCVVTVVRGLSDKGKH